MATVTLDAVVVWRIYEEALLDQRLVVASVMTQTLQGALESLPEAISQDPQQERAWLEHTLAPYHSRELGLESAAVYDSSGKIRGSVGPLPEFDKMDEDLKGALDNRQEILTMTEGVGLAPFANILQSTVPVTLQSGERWALRIRMPLVDSPGVLTRLQLAILGILLANAVLVGAVGYFLLKRRLLTPIARMTKAVGKVTAGELSERVEPTGPDELGDLGRRFNQMVAALADYRERLKEQVRSLEMANETLVATREELVASEKLASVGRLAAGIAHEVGNPLASIMGLVEVLRVDAPDAMTKDTLERVQGEVTRIDRIMKEMLDLSRPPRGVLEPCDPGQLVGEILGFMSHQPGMEGITVECDLEEKSEIVLVMPEKLRQALLNLILNAIHAMEGEGVLSIKIQALPGIGARGFITRETWHAYAPTALPDQGRFVAITVADTGPGIPPTHLQEIFDPFFTTKEPGEGTGLGLSVSLGLMEGQGGYILAESRLGTGAALTLFLPTLPPGWEGRP